MDRGRRRRGCFVVVEGLDFTGKSTVCDLVAEELGQRRLPVRKNSVKTVRLRDLSKKLEAGRRTPTLASDVLFLLAVLYDGVRISRWLRRGVSVVQDRYLPSYVWHQTSVRESGTTLPLYRLLSRKLVPDVTIYCRCSQETLWRRYRAGRRASGDAKSPNDELLFAARRDQLELYLRGFDRAILEAPNVTHISNDSSLDDLRHAVGAAVSETLTRLLDGERPAAVTASAASRRRRL